MAPRLHSNDSRDWHSMHVAVLHGVSIDIWQYAVRTVAGVDVLSPRRPNRELPGAIVISGHNTQRRRLLQRRADGLDDLGDPNVVVWDLFVDEQDPRDPLLHPRFEPVLGQLDVGVGLVRHI